MFWQGLTLRLGMMETKLLESMISITDDVKSIKFIPYRDGKKEIRFMYKGVLVRIGSIKGDIFNTSKKRLKYLADKFVKEYKYAT